ncbi:MAG: hypothetical protein K8S14_02580 [Actinomycetia bacterium]|nr:hypothetical protein [Actinomycetes bacterium]
MKKKERMITAFKNEVEPDRVPVSPDISNGIPARFSNKDFWDVFYYKNPSVWDLNLKVADFFDFEVCLEIPGLIGVEIEELFCGGLLINTTGNVELSNKIIEKSEDKLKVKYTHHTKKGDLEETLIFPKDNPPWAEEPLFKNIDHDEDKIMEIISINPWEKSGGHFNETYDRVGDSGVTENKIQLPTSWWFFNRVDITKAIMDFFDYKAAMNRIMEAYKEYALEEVRACCKILKSEVLSFGGCNASMSIISPQLYMEYNLPFVAEATKICKEHGILSHMHVGGMSEEILEMVQYTDLDIIEPLERPPSGNTRLDEVKKRFGKRFCLKGNVNTFQTLELGSPIDVKRESLKCIYDAGMGGGFVLSSGDQVPANTSYENITAMVEAAKKYGKYPLDMKLIERDLLKN